MGQGTVVMGMVLNAMPIGEYDKRITILTKEKGKITAFARGAKRPASPLLAAASPFSFGEFEVYEGRNTYNLAKAVITNYFSKLAKDLETACYGAYFLETADYFARENNDEKELLKLLYQTLRALEKGTLENRLIRRIFELRILLVEGEYPNLFSCQSCGAKEELEWFSLKKRGMACQSCKKEQDILLDSSALYAMQYILSADIRKLYTFAVSEPVLAALEQLIGRLYALQVPHKFKSLEILKSSLVEIYGRT